MNENEKSPSSNDSHPTVVGAEDKEILEQQPPNDKILSFKLINSDDDIKSKSEGKSA
ncbi:MAG: hypothetical protein ACFFDN_23465 [Candidatus Hodarchaeota archaeon]